MTLAEVADDVAQALKLYVRGKDWTSAEIGYSGTAEVLFADGSNLTAPYWRCCCEDWLLETGWEFRPNIIGFHEAHQKRGIEPATIALNGPIPWPEAPARLVSAAWRRMQETKND